MADAALEQLRIPRKQFRDTLIERGWTYRALAIRWGVTETYISRLSSDPERRIWFDDAVRGLTVDAHHGHQRMTRQEFRAALIERGWTYRAIAIRWDVTETYISRLSSDPERRIWFDDAARGLPEITDALSELTVIATRLNMDPNALLHPVICNSKRGDTPPADDAENKDQKHKKATP